jgi:hypothetical protein
MPTGHSPLNIKSDGSPEKSKMSSLAPIAVEILTLRSTIMMRLASLSSLRSGVLVPRNDRLQRIAGRRVLKKGDVVLLKIKKEILTF